VRRWLAAAGAAMTATISLACTNSGPPTEKGWQVTVYYTAVESFHDRSDTAEVVGCEVIDCTQGEAPLGRYPSTFVTAVKDEGTGRITAGPNAGRYLNWASSEGYWLDDAPRDHAGRPLEPYRSAAADGLPEGTQVRLVDCGRGYDGGPPEEEPCARLRGGQWEIRDSFTPGYGGARHIDLYIGEEDQPDFTRSDMFTSFEDASLEISPP
jgi:hypothetical protein